MRILAPVVGTLVLGGQKKEHGECRKNTYGQRHRDEDLSVQAIVNPDFQVEGLSPTRTLAQTALMGDNLPQSDLNEACRQTLRVHTLRC